MIAPPISQLNPDIPDNLTIHTFIHSSYNQAKKQIHDGASFIKEELTTIYDIAGNCLQKIVLPVNNFLKDLSQIESELRQEVSKESAHLICLNGKLIPFDQALTQPMEENY